jgi:hypothetical protein
VVLLLTLSTALWSYSLSITVFLDVYAIVVAYYDFFVLVAFDYYVHIFEECAVIVVF